MRRDVAELLTRRCKGGSALARALVQAVTGRRAESDLDLRECGDLIDYLDHASDSELLAIARRGTLPTTVVRIELALAVRGELDHRRRKALIETIRGVLAGPDATPPGLCVSAVVLSWQEGSGGAAGDDLGGMPTLP
jgi:hypothetical protein